MAIFQLFAFLLVGLPLLAIVVALMIRFAGLFAPIRHWAPFALWPAIGVSTALWLSFATAAPPTNAAPSYELVAVTQLGLPPLLGLIVAAVHTFYLARADRRTAANIRTRY